MATTLSYFIIIGYLICVPMLEEWQNDIGIQGLDGWTFQVSVDQLLVNCSSFIWCSVFIRVSSALHSWLIHDLTTLDVSAHAYFKSQEMHGKLLRVLDCIVN